MSFHSGHFPLGCISRLADVINPARVPPIRRFLDFCPLLSCRDSLRCFNDWGSTSPGKPPPRTEQAKGTFLLYLHGWPAGAPVQGGTLLLVRIH